MTRSAPPPVDSFFERPVVYRRAPDGSATLALPGAEEVWRQARPGRLHDDEAPLFTGSLTAPSVSPGAGGPQRRGNGSLEPVE